MIEAEVVGVAFSLGRSIFIALSGVLIGLALAVFVEYAKAARRTHHALPIHVALISFSYILALISLTTVASDYLFGLDTAFLRVFVFNPLMIGSGVIALFTILRYTQRRGATANRRWDDEMKHPLKGS